MKHDVKFSLPERELGKADIEFKIKRDGQKFGTLKVSRGTVVWVPKDRTYGYKMGWSQFDAVMRKEGTLEKH